MRTAAMANSSSKASVSKGRQLRRGVRYGQARRQNLRPQSVVRASTTATTANATAVMPNALASQMALSTNCCCQFRSIDTPLSTPILVRRGLCAGFHEKCGLKRRLSVLAG
ncbi:hypothetical protein D3C72_1024510 [compost metagenome]